MNPLNDPLNERKPLKPLMNGKKFFIICKKASCLQILTLIFPLLVSFLLHLGLVLIMKHAFVGAFIPHKNPWPPLKVTEVEIRFKDKNTKRFYIKDPEVDDKLPNRLTKRVPLLSKTARRVRKETLARLNGPNQNSSKAPPSAQNKKSDLLTNQNLKQWLSLENLQFNLQPTGERPTKGLTVEKKNKRQKKKSDESKVFVITPPGLLNFRVHPPSASIHHPHIQMADITALNTDKGSLEYYTFHMRLQEQLRPRWIHLLREIIRGSPPHRLQRMARIPRVTTLEVILDEQGRYMGAIVVHSSQERFFDQAARDAFEQAAPFVNPPQDMVEEDGYIYLSFSFRVELNPQHFARSK